MFGQFLKRNRRHEGIAAGLYGAIVAQARNPSLYLDLAVPDTVEGRFEMVILHTVLVLRHLRDDETEKDVGQRVFDLFCSDMDRSLREMGVGDLSVGKHMRKIAEAFYGRATAYEEGLAGSDRARVAEMLGRAVYDGNGPSAALAAYAEAADRHLAGLSKATLLSACLDWPKPAAAAETQA